MNVLRGCCTQITEDVRRSEIVDVSDDSNTRILQLRRNGGAFSWRADYCNRGSQFSSNELLGNTRPIEVCCTLHVVDITADESLEGNDSYYGRKRRSIQLFPGAATISALRN